MPLVMKHPLGVVAVVRLTLVRGEYLKSVYKTGKSTVELGLTKTAKTAKQKSASMILQ